jgi:hypothetical protein
LSLMTIEPHSCAHLALSLDRPMSLASTLTELIAMRFPLVPWTAAKR